MDHFQHPPEHRADLLPAAQPLVPFILSILCIHVQSVENRLGTTGPLFPTGHEGSLFHSRMICPAGQGWYLFEGLRQDRQLALRVDQITHHSPLFTLHSPLTTGLQHGCFTLYDRSRRRRRGMADHSSGSPVKLLKNPRRVSLGLVGRKANLSRLNP